MNFLDKLSINGHWLLSVCIPTGKMGILKRDSNALKQRGQMLGTYIYPVVHIDSVQAFQIRHGMRSLGSQTVVEPSLTFLAVEVGFAFGTQK